MNFFDNFMRNTICGKYTMESTAIQKQLDAVQVKLLTAQTDYVLLQNNYMRIKKDYDDLKSAADATSNENLQKIAALQVQISMAQEALAKQDEIVQALKNSCLFSDISFLSLPASTRQLLMYYYTKYPPATVTYNGRSLPGKPSMRYEMNVINWAQAGIGSPELNDVVKAANGYVKDIMTNESKPLHQACDVAVGRVKGWVDDDLPYRYTTDKVTTGETEYWKMALETYHSMKDHGVGSDCEDWSMLFYTLWRTAGVPAELLRLDAGITRGGEGHCSNKYFASDLTFRHVNSTTPYSSGMNVLDCPKNSDATDNMGFDSSNIWFSWNEQRAWSQDGTATGAGPEEFIEPEKIERAKFLKHVKIYNFTQK